MSDNPGYGFVPSPTLPKKELPEAPNTCPTVVNNYFTIAIDLQAALFVAFLVVFIITVIRLGPIAVRA
jgi:hypothetical protein